jgi:2-keto-4-pentenoate hydratase
MAARMSDADLDAVAERVAADIANGDHFPAWLSKGLDEGALTVQVRHLHRSLDGERLARWKVGLTSERARRALWADVRPFGYLVACHVFAPGAEIPASTTCHPSIEVEFLLTIARPRGAGVTPADARAGIDRVAAGFELNERRAGSARPDLVAMATDRMTRRGVVEGTGVDPRGVDLNDVVARVWCNDEQLIAARSGDEGDDHWTSIATLAVELDRCGLGLEPDHKVITRALGRFDVAPGEQWRASFDGVGDVAIRAR